MRYGQIQKLSKGTGVVVIVQKPYSKYEAHVCVVYSDTLSVRVTKVIVNNSPDPITVGQQREVAFSQVSLLNQPKKSNKKSKKNRK